METVEEYLKCPEHQLVQALAELVPKPEKWQDYGRSWRVNLKTGEIHEVSEVQRGTPGDREQQT